MNFWMFIWVLVFFSFYLEVFMLFEGVIWMLDVFILLFYFKNSYGLCKNHDFCWIMVRIIKFEWNILCMEL